MCLNLFWISLTLLLNFKLWYFKLMILFIYLYSVKYRILQKLLSNGVNEVTCQRLREGIKWFKMKLLEENSDSNFTHLQQWSFAKSRSFSLMFHIRNLLGCDLYLIQLVALDPGMSLASNPNCLLYFLWIISVISKLQNFYKYLVCLLFMRSGIEISNKAYHS